MSGLVEIRDYNYETDRLAEYRGWASQAVPILSDRLEVLGFWIDDGIPARIDGSAPIELPHGPAKHHLDHQWDDMEHREEAWARLWEDTDWLQVWDLHPGFESYLHMSVRFLKSAT